MVLINLRTIQTKMIMYFVFLSNDKKKLLTLFIISFLSKPSFMTSYNSKQRSTTFITRYNFKLGHTLFLRCTKCLKQIRLELRTSMLVYIHLTIIYKQLSSFIKNHFLFVLLSLISIHMILSDLIYTLGSISWGVLNKTVAK